MQNEKTNPPAKPDKLTAALGGADIELVNNAGEAEILRVHILPVRLAEDYLRQVVEGNQQSAAALACQCEVEELDRFPPDEILRLFEEAERLNFTHCEAALRGRSKSVMRALPLLREGMGKAMTTLAAEFAQEMQQQLASAINSAGSSGGSAPPAGARPPSGPH